MKHLTREQLSARLDDALTGRQAAEAERHLAACEACRGALAALAAQDASLRPALTHVPDEAYFEDFPARVEDRIRAAGLAGAQARGQGFDLGRFFRSPRALTWAGAAAVIVAGAGLALMTAREVRPPDLRDRDLAGRVERAAPAEAPRDQAPAQAAPGEARRDAGPGPAGLDGVERAAPLVSAAPDDRQRADALGQAAPAPAGSALRETPPGRGEWRGAAAPGSRAERSATRARVADEDRAAAPEMEPRIQTPLAGSRERKDQPMAAPPPKPLAQSPPADARPPSPARAVEVQRNEAGEEVPVPRPGESRFAPPPPPAAKGEADQAANIRKKQHAEPLRPGATWGQTKALYGSGTKHDSAAREYSFARPEVVTRRSATTRSITGGPSAEGEVRLCGEVHDVAGRPVAGAQVVVADLGRSATTDSRGGFCISAPPGEHPLSVIAVGYTEARQSVRVGGDQAAVRITLATVAVLEDKRAAIAERVPLPRMPATPPPEPRDHYSALPDTTRLMVRGAQRLGAEAAARRSAALFDASAAGWERALRRLAGGPLELESRWHLAEARYHAWDAGPNERRAAAAVEALTAYVARSPAGAERAQAVGWLDRVSR